MPRSLESTWEVPGHEVRWWRGRTKDWCVVIPVINEGERIGSFLRRLAAAEIPEQADVLVVDGGSTDDSLRRDLLDECAVAGLIEKTGPGRLSAQLRCAYAFAIRLGYRGVVTIDGNDKDDPSAVPDFIQALADGVDFVQASRFVPGGEAVNTPPNRLLAIRLLHAPVLSAAARFRWTDTTQGFRAYSQRLLLDPKVAPFRSVFDGYELLAYMSYRAPRLGYSCVELPTTRRYPSDEIPTKITGLRGNWELLKVLVLAALGRYNPEEP